MSPRGAALLGAAGNGMRDLVDQSCVLGVYCGMRPCLAGRADEFY